MAFLVPLRCFLNFIFNLPLSFLIFFFFVAENVEYLSLSFAEIIGVISVYTINRVYEYYPNIVRDICGYPSIDGINPKPRIVSVTVCEL